MSVNQEVSSEVAAALAKLAVGDSAEVLGRGGWKIGLTRVNVGGKTDLIHFNPLDGTGKRRFFLYTTDGNPYGAGMVVQEPTLGIKLRDCGVDRDGRLVGAIVLDADGKIKVGDDGKPCRFSWSNLVYAQHKTVGAVDGQLLIDGVSYGHLALVFIADKNRIDGYVGIFKPTKPETVRVAEMEEFAVEMAKAAA